MSLSRRLANAPLRRIYQTKKVVPLGPWRPDIATFGNPGVVRVANAAPYFNSYKSFPGLSVTTTALNARSQGTISEQDKDGDTREYSGDASKLYGLVAGTYTDYSKAGGYTVAPEEHWEFVKFGNQMFACHIGDPVQEVTMGSVTFADLFTSTLKPKARHMTVVRNRFLTLGNVEEGGELFPNRVRWAAIDDATDMDQSAVTLSDFQDLEGPGGRIQKVVGGRDYGTIFQVRQIQRMEFIGSPEVFSFDEVETDRGAWAANSVVPLGRFAFYLAEDGFYVFDGVQSIPIGDGKINRDFFSQLDGTYRHRINGAIFFDLNCIGWAYTTSATAGGGDPDLILLYHWPSGEWAEIDIDTEIIFTALSQGFTVEGLDAVNTSLDALDFSLDSRVWQGGNPLFSGFDRAHKSGPFNGSDLTATWDTGGVQLNKGEKATVKAIRSLVDGTAQTTTIALGRRDRLVDSNSFGSAVSINANGEHSFRAQSTRARYHQIRLNVSGGFDHAQGFEVEWGGGGTQ